MFVVNPKTLVGLIDSIRRWRLVQEGLSSGKKRRTQDDKSLLGKMERSVIIRSVIYLAFLLGIMAMLWQALDFTSMGAFNFLAMLFVLTVCALAIFQLNHQDCARKNGSVFLIFGGIIFQIWVVILVGKLAVSGIIPVSFHFLIIPFALAPIVHSVLLGQRAGVFSAVFGSLFSAFLMPAEDRWVFMAMSLFCGLVAVIATRHVRKRGRLLRAGFWVGAAALILDLLFGKIEIMGLGSWEAQAWRHFGEACAAALGVGLLTGLLVGGLLPALEGVFGLTTEITWLELSDLNHPLLRQMQIEAPGTFHHSLVVAALSEAAAEAIGVDALQCRVSAYFHDIGKLNKPEYFIENQGEGNPHDQLTPTMSALIITAHVKDGVDLAIKNKLNPRILEVIQEHHGDSLVYYFYRKAQERLAAEQQEKAKNDGEETTSEDLPQVDEKSFRYPGPIPQSKESGIISLADAVESASRTIKKPSPSRIRSLVDEIVFKRIKDGQLDHSGLDLSELSKIREVFSKTLRSMLHARIEYPKEILAEGPSGKTTPVRAKAPPAKIVPAEEVEKARRSRQQGQR